jgi:hypothetical protein
MRRRWWILLLLLGCVGLWQVFLLVRPDLFKDPSSKHDLVENSSSPKVGEAVNRDKVGEAINRRNFRRIDKGMTREDVVAILGGPPGDYTRREEAKTCLFRFAGDDRSADEEWQGDNGTILLRFRNGRVIRRAYFLRNGEQIGDPESLFDW